MRKSLVLAITALGGGVSYGAGTVHTSSSTAPPDPATWRWHVNTILDGQKSEPPEKVATNLGRLYERYTLFGLPERR